MAAMATSRDLRSEDRPSKKDRDQRCKWGHGVRPLAGKDRIEMLGWEKEVLGPDSKVRPAKQWTHQAAARRYLPPRDTKFDNTSTVACSKMPRKASPFDAAPLTRSLLELLPTHRNKSTPAIHTSAAAFGDDAGVLYSFDKATTPGKRVELGGWVERAELKWVEAQTEKMVQDYEMLDLEGAVIHMGKGRKGRTSPRTKAKILEEGSMIVDFEIIELGHL